MRSIGVAFQERFGGYALPNCHRTWEEWQRLRHRDLPSMSAEELRVERFRVERAYAEAFGRAIYVYTTGLELFVTAEEWLHGRLQALEAETRRRNRGRVA